jgi:hypothetical protein
MAGHELIKVTKIFTQLMMLRLLVMIQVSIKTCTSCGYNDWLRPENSTKVKVIHIKSKPTLP